MSAIDQRAELQQFNDWAWKREGEPIGMMHGSDAARAAWLARAALAPSQPAEPVNCCSGCGKGSTDDAMLAVYCVECWEKAQPAEPDDQQFDRQAEEITREVLGTGGINPNATSVDDLFDAEPVAQAEQHPTLDQVFPILNDFRSGEIDAETALYELCAMFNAASRPVRELSDDEIKAIYAMETGFYLDESPAALMDFARALLARATGESRHAN